MTMFFFSLSKNSHCDLDLGSRMLILKFVQARVVKMVGSFYSKNGHCDLDFDP